MRWLRKLISLPLALLVIPVLWLTLTWQALAATVLQPEWARQSLAGSGAHAALPSLAGTYLQAGLAEQEGPALVSPDDVQSLVDEALPPAAAAELLGAVVDRGYGWLAGREPRPDLEIDLQGVRDRIRAPLDGLLTRRWLALPACTDEQMQALTAEDGGPRTPQPWPACRPTGEAGGQPPVSARALTDYIPAALDLGAAFERVDPAIWERLSLVRPALRFMQQQAWVAWLVLLAWLGLLVGLNLDWWYTPLGWVGWPLLLGGGALALGGVALRGLHPLLISPRLPTGGVAGVLDQWSESVLTVFSNQLLLSGLVAGGTGLLLALVLIAAAIAAPAPHDRSDSGADRPQGPVPGEGSEPAPRERAE